MVYRFTIISDEVDDFRREIKIDSEATFHELHETILKSCGYTDDQMTSFFICDESWAKEIEVTLEDMGSSSEEDSYIMRETRISELCEDEKQHLLYVFDPLADRVFFIELSEIIYGQDITSPICSKKYGDAPQQAIDFDELMTKETSLDLGENFYGDEDFDMDEFDPDGFSMGDAVSLDENIPYE
jgi:hypothetical protein